MRWLDVVFLDAEDVERIQVEAIKRFGGEPGMLDRGLLESAVMSPRQGYCSTLAELAAAYAFGIAKNHAFRDGNKRAGLGAMLLFLELNGFVADVNEGDWEVVMVDLVTETVSREELADRIATHLLGGGPVYIEGDT